MDAGLPTALLLSWPPPFTDDWATTYLQVLVESFFFALSVPAAAFSLVVDNDIKRVTLTRVTARNYFMAASLLFVSISLLVWFMHPEPAPQQLDAPLPASLVAKSVFAAATVTILPPAVLIVGLWQIPQFRRERVVDRLAELSIRPFKSEGRLDHVALEDLAYIGEHSKAGDEKDYVLGRLNRLVQQAQKAVGAPGTHYRGFELEPLIRGIPRMLDNAAQPGSDENYDRAAETLANIWRWLAARPVSHDSLATCQAIRHLALRAVERAGEGTAFAYLDIAAECDNHIVFDMGVAALAASNYRLASAALNKLEAISDDTAAKPGGPKPGAGHADADGDGAQAWLKARRELEGDMLGLAAHFAACGPSGLRRVRITLNQRLFEPTLRAALDDASEYHYDAGRYETCDKVRLLASEAAGMEEVELDRPAAPPESSHPAGPPAATPRGRG